MSAFDSAIAFTLAKKIEGGYVNDPTDRGGETNFGITNSTFLSSQRSGIISATIPSVKYITQQDAINIYRASYWSNYNLDEVAKISPALSVAIFDFVVNSGSTGVTKLQGLLGVNQDGNIGPATLTALQANSNITLLTDSYLQARRDNYAAIIANNPSQVKYKNGWENRVAALEDYLPTIPKIFSSTDTSTSSDVNTWTVGAGATGELIAAASGITLPQLQAANPGINVANPPVGTVLNLPTVQNGLLNFTNNIDSNGGPVWNTGNVENSAPTGANDFVFSEGSFTGFFTEASNNGIHNVAGSIVTDGWMPGAEVFSSINFISDNALPSSGFYTGGSWSSYGINLGSSYNYGIDLGAATFNNFSFSAYDFLSIDPLVLDLNGDGVKLTDYDSAPVLFDIDHDANGSLEQTGWVSAEDGILVHDIDADGKINNISETISEYYTGAIGVGSSTGERKHINGFTALKSLDSNNDNQFTAADATYTQLRVWQDANHDGKTDSGELKTLASLGITSISLSSTKQSGLVNGGNEVLATGSFVQNGITKQAQAVNLLANPVGHTFSATATGARITSDNGLQSYVSHNAAGETIDFAVKGVRNGYGNNGNDTLIGDANSNWLVGGQGSDTFNAGAGDDVLLIDADDQQANIHAGSGLDIAQVVGDAGVVLNLTQAELEVAIGGRGDDILIGGGRSNIFISGGEGDDIIIGGAADDALSGEEGSDLIDGGAGDDLIRGHRGIDQLMGGDGNDLIEGGLDDDNLSGGTGNDLLKGEQGDDKLDGGDGYDVVKLAGSYADYRITQVNTSTYRIVDTRTGRDGVDTLTNIEAVTFADIGNIKLNQPIVMAVDDSVSVSSGAPNYVITKASLFDNDLNLNGGILQLKSFGDAVGGTVSQNTSGDFVFTPTAGYAGVMSFTYGVQTSAGQFISATLPNGQSAPLKATVTLKTPNLPTDPLFAEQRYLNDVKVVPVWKDYTGKGVRIGQFEPDMPFQTETMVFDYRHPDLQANVDQSWLASGAAPASFSSHATMVAGVMVAAKDGQGTVGVAYDAKLSGISLGSSTAAPDWSLLDQWQNYDIVNNSWSPAGNFAYNYLYPENETIDESLKNAAVYGRRGLGTSVVFSAGNQRLAGQDANQMLSNGRFSIQVGSVNHVQDLGALLPALTPYSNRGASILVSAPGSNITTTARLLMNGEGSVFGDDTEAVNGTSFAAPIVTGVIALMLEANPNLGYRDIQEILALSATKVATDPTAPTDWLDNHATNWNGGGMHTSHDYGFGQVDARAAVRLAESWMRTSVIGNGAAGVNNESVQVSGVISPNVAIPANGTTYTQNITMAAGLSVEHVELLLDIDHQKYGDLIVKLVSPTGTESLLLNRMGNGNEPSTGELRYVFGSTHHWGETSEGVWKVQITDAAAGNVGTLKFLNLNLYGKDVFVGDNAYYYTDEFGSVGAGARLTLADTNNGLDTINAAAVTNNSTINLTTGIASISGKAVAISSPANFENVFGGDGADTLTGNAGINRLSGGRGNDVISGAAGRDILEGGQGNDTLTGGTEIDMFVIRKDASSTDTVIDFSITGREKVALVGFGAFTFADLTKTQVGTNTVVGLGNSQTIQLNNVTATSLTADNFNFFDNFNYARQYIGTNAADPDFQFPTSTALPSLYLAGAGNDIVFGGFGQDTIYGEDGNDTLVGENSSEDTVGAGDIIYGGTGDDVLFGGGGDDTLYGGLGKDEFYGGDGNDTIFLEGDVFDIPTAKYFVFGNVGSDRFVLTDTAVSSNLANFILDFDPLDPNEKIDLLAITSITAFNQLTLQQIDIYNNGVLSTIVKTGGGSAPSLMLWNVALNKISASNFIFYQPLVNVDVLNGNAGGNYLTGSTGADVMTGRTGDDTYIVDNLDDTLIELAGGGYDAVQSSVTHILRDNLEQLTLTGTTAINGTGNNDANRLVGNTGNNIIDGKGGSDDMRGGAGSDTYVVEAGSDRVTENANEGTDTVQSSVSWTLGKNLENLTLSGLLDVNATGNELVNTLVGNAADNILDGAQGADNMTGGSGNDTYYVDSASDTITELANGGYDTVYSSVNISTLDTTSAAHVEQLILAIGATQGTGNALDNVLIGNDVANTLNGLGGADYLDGGLGADTMIGGLGNDTYVRDNASDVITETSIDINEIDTVLTNIAYTLGANLENLTLTGTAAVNGTGNNFANVITGNAAINTLNGGDGNDTLDGGLGIDSLVGGNGNDVYVVDTTTDNITEAATAGAGIDTVQSSITYTLGATSNLENLTLTGTTNINATGNGQNNILTGNAGNNTLDGLAGIDTMIGGFGDDTYILDVANDVVTELSGQGTDTVNIAYNNATATAVSLTLNTGNLSNIENLIVTGTGLYNLTGDATNNILTGNASANTLNGGDGNDTLNGLAGNDTMIGGLGNDTYFLDVATDTVTEAAGQGTDTVNIAYNNANTTTAVTLTLNTGNLANIENLTVTGTGLYNLTGSIENNILTGNASANSLNGGDGNDTLNGLAGNDTMIGGSGNDTYILDVATDVVTEAAGQGTDTVNIAYNNTNTTTAVTLTLNTTGNLANIENLTVTGTGLYNLTGSAANNVLNGNAINNTLNGIGGNDTLNGGLGNDTYLSGRFMGVNIWDETTLDQDRIIDTDTTAGNADTLVVEAYLNNYTRPITYTEYQTTTTLKRTLENGYDNLSLAFRGDPTDSGDTEYFERITIQDYFKNASSKVENIQFADTGPMSLESFIASRYYDYTGSSANDIMIGTAGVGAMIGGAGDDYMRGTNTGQSTDDYTLNTNGIGNDIIQGLGDTDALYDIRGNNLLDGGSGTDLLNSGYRVTAAASSKSLLIGGRDDDWIFSGDQADIILFNKGDGKDEVYTSAGASDTLSIGGAVGSLQYDQLKLAKTGNDLILKISTTDQMTFKNWYSGTANRTITNLQVIAEAINGFVESADVSFNNAGTNLGKLKNNKIESFNFSTLVGAFDSAMNTPNVTNTVDWNLTDARLTAHLKEGSNSAAIGGDLAYQYGKNSNLINIGLLHAQNVISNSSFGQTAQAFSTSASAPWQNESIKLA